MADPAWLIRVAARIWLIFSGLLLAFTAWQAAAETPEMAPDFALPDIHTGEITQLSDYRGKIVLVDFWASWCGPCRASFPAYEALRQRLQAGDEADDFEILAINVDVSAEEGLAFLKESPVTFPVLRETSGATQQNYQLIVMPTSFLIDPDGRILIAHQGFREDYTSYLESVVTRLRTARLQN